MMMQQDLDIAKSIPARLPAVPDRRFVTTPAAAAALDGVWAAGRMDERFRDLDLAAARVLAALLRLYAELGRPPSRAEIAARAALTEADAERRLAELQRRDLILRDRAGAIVGAYPFTQSPSGPRVTLAATRQTVATMCALDALGAGAMCRQDTIVQAACRGCQTSIVATTRGGGLTLAEFQPRTAVVWTAFAPSRGCLADSLCVELTFFCSDAHLDAWRQATNAGDGRRLTVEEGFQVGKALFADRALLGDG